MSSNPAEVFPEAYKICEKFVVSNAQLKEIERRMQEEMEQGLHKETQHGALLKCWATYIQDMPKGNECGRFVSLNLNEVGISTHLVILKDGKVQQLTSKYYKFSERQRSGSGEELCNYIAECLADFLKDYNVENVILPFACTTSFQLRQIDLSHSVLMGLSKRMRCKGLIGKDIGILIQDALKKRDDVFLKVVAIVNDTVATFMASAIHEDRCRIGATIGQSTNACYLESIRNISTFDSCTGNNKTHMLLNVQWGAFGENGALEFIRTDYDRQVDKATNHPGTQTYEKIISGAYIGELVRLIIIDLMRACVLFNGKKSEGLCKRWTFQTEDVVTIDMDSSDSYSDVQTVLKRLGLDGVSEDDLAMVRYICEMIITRAARIAAVGFASLLNRLKEKHVVIGIDGFLVHRDRNYLAILESTIRALIKPDKNFEIMLISETGLGAGIVAAMAVRHL